VCRYGLLARVIARDQLALPSASRSSRAKALTGKGLLPRRLLDDRPERQEAAIPRSPLVHPALMRRRGPNPSGLPGDRWRDGGTARECCAHLGVQAASTLVEIGWPKVVALEPGATCPSLGAGCLEAIPVLQLTVATAFAWVRRRR